MSKKKEVIHAKRFVHEGPPIKPKDHVEQKRKETKHKLENPKDNPIKGLFKFPTCPDPNNNNNNAPIQPKPNDINVQKKNDNSSIPSWDKKAKDITGVQDDHFPDSPVPQKHEDPKPQVQLKSAPPISVQVKEEVKSEVKSEPPSPKIETVTSSKDPLTVSEEEDTSNVFVTVMHDESQRVEGIPLGHSIRDVIVASLAAFDLKGNPDHYILMDWNKKQQKKQFTDIDKKERFTGIVLMKMTPKEEPPTISSPEVWRLSITVMYKENSQENSRVFRVPISPTKTCAEVIEVLVKILKENNIVINNPNLVLTVLPHEIVLPLKERIDSAISQNESDKLLVKI